ncbi:hypothetical protein [Mycobacterium simiae]|uniref:hypothetical protein n=1 Tax=Mycobacterium simiae TaxID=1784 RepID=UPI002636220A|nr:hypothetical protein [Mycobacterium simiae]
MTSVEKFQASTDALAAATQAQALAVYTAYQAGRLTRDQTVSLIAAVVNQFNAAAASLADVGLSAQIEQAAGIPTPPTGIVPADSTARLEKAVNTILSEDQPPAENVDLTRQSDNLAGQPHSEEQAVEVDRSEQSPGPESEPRAVEPPEISPPHSQMRIDRLARSEPLEAAQQATIEAMQQQPLVEGWTRQMDADPCQLCRWWWREGRIWPKDHPFQSHKGCNCTPRVVLAENIESTMYTRRLERERAARITD